MATEELFHVEPLYKERRAVDAKRVSPFFNKQNEQKNVYIILFNKARKYYTIIIIIINLSVT